MTDKDFLLGKVESLESVISHLHGLNEALEMSESSLQEKVACYEAMMKAHCKRCDFPMELHGLMGNKWVCPGQSFTVRADGFYPGPAKCPKCGHEHVVS